MFVLCVLSGIAYMVAGQIGQNRTNERQFARPEFEEKIIGQFPNKVVKLVGEPAARESLGHITMFGYIDKTHKNGKTDRKTIVTFHYGICDSVEYHEQ
jgi:hypothetical protein